MSSSSARKSGFCQVERWEARHSSWPPPSQHTPLPNPAGRTAQPRTTPAAVPMGRYCGVGVAPENPAWLVQHQGPHGAVHGIAHNTGGRARHCRCHPRYTDQIINRINPSEHINGSYNTSATDHAGRPRPAPRRPPAPSQTTIRLGPRIEYRSCRGHVATQDN